MPCARAAQTYEHIDPKLVGNERRFLISELSGKSNILAELEKAKLTEDKALAKKILARVQELENEGYQFEAANASFDLLTKRVMGTFKPSFELIKYHVDVEKQRTDEIVTEATVKLRVGDRVEHVVGEGDGPVNALDAALRRSLEAFYPAIREMHLIDYKVRVVNARAGTAARVRVVIESRDKQSIWGTVGVSENIIEASWLALVDSVEYKLQKLAHRGRYRTGPWAPGKGGTGSTLCGNDAESTMPIRSVGGAEDHRRCPGLLSLLRRSRGEESGMKENASDIGLGVVIVLLVLGGFGLYRVIRGPEKLSGPLEAIPQPIAAPEPIRRARRIGLAGEASTMTAKVRSPASATTGPAASRNSGKSTTSAKDPEPRHGRARRAGQSSGHTGGDEQHDLVFCLNPETGD